MNFPLYIGLRYLKAKKNQNVINIISMISIIGICVTTAALVVVLSVFNGFEELVASMYNTFDPDLQITAAKGKTFHNSDLDLTAIRQIDEVQSVSEVVEDNALIKGFFGTHTHVQTADEQIYEGMAYITDAGFCGAIDSVIGMEFETSLRRLSTSLPERYEIAENPIAQINGVEVLIDRTKATQIKRINVTIDNNGSEESGEG